MTATNASKTIVGVFSSIREANAAVQQLVSEGVNRDDISLVANQAVSDQGVEEGYDPTVNIGNGAGIGAAIGGTGGLLLSLAGLAIPGIGPVLAAGPLVAAIGGAGIGAAVGGMVGALVNLGIPEEDAHHYAEGVRRGDVLVTVKDDGSMASRIGNVLDQGGAVNINDRVANWRERGYNGFSHEGEPYSADQIAREREYYGSGSVRSDADRVGDSMRSGLNRAEGSVERGMHNAGQALREVGQDIKEGARELKYSVEDKAHEAGRGLRNLGNRAEDAVEDTGTGIRRSGARVYDRLDR